MKTRNVRERQWRRYFRKMESLDPELFVCPGYTKHMSAYASRKRWKQYPYVFPVKEKV